jgi:hypothetical protein
MSLYRVIRIMGESQRLLWPTLLGVEHSHALEVDSRSVDDPRTSTTNLRVGQRLHEDYANGKTYYPFDSQLSVPRAAGELPSGEFLAWHNEHVFRG